MSTPLYLPNSNTPRSGVLISTISYELADNLDCVAQWLLDGNDPIDAARVLQDQARRLRENPGHSPIPTNS